MEIIQLKEVWKIYDIKQHRTGFLGGMKDLFSSVYVTKEAVRGINLSIAKGEAVGYIGPNGSGKSTTIKMLTGILSPTRGTVKVNGLEPSKHRKENAAKIGVVFGQKSQLWWDLNIKETFELFRHIYRIPKGVFTTNLELMMELLNLAEFENTPVRQLSLGQRMRAEVACAFFHEPAICYLDEPTIGLDVVAKEELRKFLREINRYKQVSIVLTTHDMDDIEQICERLVLIDHGQIIYDGTTLDFKQIYGTERVLTVEFEEEVPSLHIAGARVVANERKRATLVFQKNEVTATQLIQELASSYPVLDCELTEPKIENLVRHVYSQKEHLHE